MELFCAFIGAMFGAALMLAIIINIDNAVGPKF